MRLTVVNDPAPNSVERLRAAFAGAHGNFLSLGLDPATLDLGTAVWAPKLCRLHDANCVFNVRVPIGSDAAVLWRDANAWFDANDCRLRKIFFSAAATDVERDPLVAIFQQQQWQEHRRDVLRLERAAPGPSTTAPAGVSVLSARAVRRQYEAFAREVAATTEPQLADLALLRLDDPHWEVIVALQGGAVVARAGVLTHGEVGLIENVVVRPGHRRQGFGRLVMQHAINLCARSQFRHVLLGCEPANTAAHSLYASLGFAKVSEYVEWRDPSVTAAPEMPA